MKSLFSKLGNKLAEAADNIAAYNAGIPAQTARPAASGPSFDGKGRPVDPDTDALADPVLQHLLRNVRSKHVRQHFAKSAPNSYTEHHDLRLLAGSYNVNGKAPPPQLDLKPWLGSWDAEWPSSSGSEAQGCSSGSGLDAGRAGADVVAVGFQEIVPLNAGNVLVGPALRTVEAWDRALGAMLNGEEWASTAASGLETAADGQGREPLLGASGAAASGAYVQVVSKLMVGTYLSVWVRRSLLSHVRGVQVTHVATGFGGWTGNKGAVVARMLVFDSPLVLVNAHLSAGDKEGDEGRRNADVAAILARADFSLNAGAVGPMAAPAAALASAALGAGYWGEANLIGDHPNAVWMGDLNYRLARAVISDEEARKALRAGRLDVLLEADQLCRERKAGRVFQGWHEGPIAFEPTFKFKVGTHQYLGEAPAGGMAASESRASLSRTSSSVDGRGSNANNSSNIADDDNDDGDGDEEGGKQKKRTPAYCDRVLWWTTAGQQQQQQLSACPGLRQVGYARGEITASDHKPVAAAFIMRARHYSRPKVESLLDASMRAVEMMKMAQRPRCRLEPPVISVGELSYCQRATFSVTLRNSGQGEGVFHFVPPPGAGTLDDERPALPAWLTAVPAEGVVPAGGEVEIQLSVCVEGGSGGGAAALYQEAAREAASNPSSCSSRFPPLCLDTIVILRVEDGGDLFLSTTGSCAGSFLGMPLATLVALPAASSGGEAAAAAEAAADHQAAEALAAAGHLQEAGAAAAAAAAAPREAQALAAWLLRSGALRARGIFVRSAAEVLAAASAAAAGAAADAEQQLGSADAPWSNRRAVRAVLQALAPLRQALEAGGGVSPGSSPHEAAALLLALFAELPAPLMPPAVVELCNTQVPAPSTLGPLLASSLPTADLSTLSLTLGLFRHALSPDLTAANGVTVEAAAEVLAALWFPPLLPATPADAADNRRALMAALLRRP